MRAESSSKFWAFPPGVRFGSLLVCVHVWCALCFRTCYRVKNQLILIPNDFAVFPHICVISAYTFVRHTQWPRWSTNMHLCLRVRKLQLCCVPNTVKRTHAPHTHLHLTNRNSRTMTPHYYSYCLTARAAESFGCRNRYTFDSDAGARYIV